MYSAQITLIKSIKNNAIKDKEKPALAIAGGNTRGPVPIRTFIKVLNVLNGLTYFIQFII